MRRLPSPSAAFPAWLRKCFRSHNIVLWGAADLRRFSTPKDNTGRGFPFALSFIIPMNPSIMVKLQHGPNQDYADEYQRVNNHLGEFAATLAAELRGQGYRAQPLAPSERTDTVAIKGDFPHKTAATRAGLGWIGRHCQLITRDYGPWVRLGTVFTDTELPCGPALERSYCGGCMRCVDACPAKALKGKAWYPGLPREAIMDAGECDKWKKEHYLRYRRGHVCGICSAVCPYGLKVLKKDLPLRSPGEIFPK